MRIWVVSVGRDRTGPTRDLVADYAGRCAWPVSLVEIGPRTGSDLRKNRADEAERILRALPAGSRLIALDEGGETLDSRGLAARLSEVQAHGVPDLGFVIGGADGLDAALLRRADLTLAFGRMTWPHRLARVMLLEQLYRASTILAGHPYHRD